MTQSAIEAGCLDSFVKVAKNNACQVFFADDNQDAWDIIQQLNSELNTELNTKECPGRDKINLSPQAKHELNIADLKRIESGSTQGDDPCCVSTALAALEDTGSLVLASGPDNPTSLNFLSDHHIVLLNPSNIFKNKKAFWHWFRQNKTPMPRALNFISGPSRTADIEQTIQLGAHGPRQLSIILLN